jgi:outer membrane protein OmpA-like peptidoglycan-associated protein
MQLFVHLLIEDAIMNTIARRRNAADATRRRPSPNRTSRNLGALTAAGALVVLALSPQPRGVAQSLADRLKGVQSGNEGPPPPTLPVWKPVSAATSTMQIPLVKGLIVSGAQAGEKGDQEQIRNISNVTPQAVTMVIEWDTPSTTPGKPPDRKVTNRIVDMADLKNSHRFMVYFHIGQTEHYPGATGFGTSAEVLNQLKAGQPTEMDFEANPDPIMTIGTSQKDPNRLVGWNGNPMNKCLLHRVGTTDVSIPMLVNSAKVELPAIHTMCTIGVTEKSQADFYFLDQPSNPILIAGQDEGGISQMIKIDFPAQTNDMEQALAEKKPVQIYGIYFDFNSATIKPDSEAVLKQISDILHKNPDWKLSVAGHTDNIGEAAFNQQLSEHRAAAVKEALVSRYGIAADRLSTSGYGASRPVEPNTTLEGRARNRRVELQRQ